MKSYVFLIGVAMMMVACGQKTIVEKTQSELLKERLETLQQKGYMTGHQDDPFYGVHWEYEDGRKTRYMNPGSPSIPKENTVPSYIIIENGKAELFTFG